jgi:hypothetical protein
VTINGVAALAGSAHNVSLDNLVKRRQEEAVHVFAYFLHLIMEGELKRMAAPVGSSQERSRHIIHRVIIPLLLE